MVELIIGFIIVCIVFGVSIFTAAYLDKAIAEFFAGLGG